MSLIAKLKEFEKQMRDEGTKVIQDECRKLFSSYPELNHFTIVAFTDYFNDGDECRYHYREYQTRINGYLVEDDDEKIDGKTSPLSYEIKNQINTSIWEIFNEIPSTIFKSIYGDHIAVTFKRDGTHEVEDFADHQ